MTVAGSVVALACFLLGGATAARLAARRGDNRLHQLREATAVQAVLCAVTIPVAAVAGDDLGPGSRYALIVLLALAMGIQNVMARRLAVADLTTTVLTMTLTGIAADSRLGGGSGTKTARRVVSIAAMLLGAAIGALLLLRIAPVAPLAVGAAVVAIVSVAAHRAGRLRVRPSRFRGRS
jgi:uncharacterized membrane protein YoaK (UPF0700 family)